MNYLITILILLAVAGGIWAENRRQDRLEAAEAAWHATRARVPMRPYTQQDADDDTTTIALKAIRDQPEQNLAWGRPPETGYVTVRIIDDCGCLRWLIHPDGFVEPAYGPCPPHEAMTEVEMLARRPQ